jgi:hypothetical protein
MGKTSSRGKTLLQSREMFNTDWQCNALHKRIAYNITKMCFRDRAYFVKYQKIKMFYHSVSKRGIMRDYKKLVRKLHD